MPRGKCPSGGRQAGHIVPTFPRWTVLHHRVLREVKKQTGRRLKFKFKSRTFDDVDYEHRQTGKAAPRLKLSADGHLVP